MHNNYGVCCSNRLLAPGWRNPQGFRYEIWGVAESVRIPIFGRCGRIRATAPWT